MRSNLSFSVQDGVLTISPSDGSHVWEGLPDGMPVHDLRAAPDGRSAFVLLETPAGAGRVRNLVRITAHAKIVWRGELPEVDPTDAFVSLATDADGAVLASTWSGYRVRLDPDTGCLLGQVFTK